MPPPFSLAISPVCVLCDYELTFLLRFVFKPEKHNVPSLNMTTQIVISSLQDSQNQDDTVILIEFQGTLECEQDDVRGLRVGDLEENEQVTLERE